MNITGTRNLATTTPPKANSPAPQVPTEKAGGEPVDRADSVGSNIVYKTARTVSGAAGGALGAVVGLPFGTFKGAVSESNQLSPKAVKLIRTAGAIVATGVGVALALNGQGALLGLNTFGAVAAAAVGGPIVGVVAASTAIGVGEGLASGLSGGFEGTVAFAKKGAGIGAGAVDWIVGK